jgi:hypothetical protein
MITASEAGLRIEAFSLRVQQPASSRDLVSLAMASRTSTRPCRSGRLPARALAEGHTLLEVLAEEVGGLLCTSASASDMIVTQGARPD